MRQNATRTQIARALRTGISDSAIARTLRADRHRVSAIRRANGYPAVPQQPLTLEEKWRRNTNPVAGGHLEWRGERQSTSGSPVMRYREEPYSPTAIAFRIRHGRDPQGYVIADCGMRHCVAPDHVEDEPMRTATREALRLINGTRTPSTTCIHGHGQNEHARYGPDGVRYCGRCKANQKAEAAR